METEELNKEINEEVSNSSNINNKEEEENNTIDPKNLIDIKELIFLAQQKKLGIKREDKKEIQLKKIKSISKAKYNNLEKTTLDCEVELKDGTKIPYTYLCSGDDDKNSDVAADIGKLLKEGKIEIEEYVETEEIIKRKIAEKEMIIRSERNEKLQATDYMVLPDSPFTTEQKKKIKEYRQNLRNITEQETFPDSVVWPELNLE